MGFGRKPPRARMPPPPPPPPSTPMNPRTVGGGAYNPFSTPFSSFRGTFAAMSSRFAAKRQGRPSLVAGGNF